MAPRRSARASLPTPTHSTTSSTPTMSIKMEHGQVRNGMMTPSSLTDGDDDDADVKVEDGKESMMPAERKRKVASPSPDFPFTASPSAPASPSEVRANKRSKRYTLDVVELPSRRSKLSTDKTESADNLTLGSSAHPHGARTSSGIIKSDPLGEEDDELDLLATKSTPRIGSRTTKSIAKSAETKSKSRSAAGQPFNIGTYSNIKKQTASDLALSDEEEEKPKRGKKSGGGKGKAKKELSAEEEDFKLDVDEGGNFAMDSEEEAEQLKKALKASKRAPRAPRISAASSSAASSRAASKVRASEDSRKTGTPVGGSASGRTLRVAVARAAEKRLRANNGNATPSSMSPAPSAGDPSDESATPDFLASDSPLTDEGSFESDSFSSASESEAPKKRRGNPKGRGRHSSFGVKTKGAPQKLGIDLAGMDDETRIMTIEKVQAKRREERKRWAEARKPIKDAEKKLKNELGRKLTNGEKNFIALKMYHTELVNVWGDLTANVVPVKPVPMEAHPSLKLTLLPFQKESLYWMKKQEEGPWKGGMLADEMGMGKTIQTIALLLSEPRQKPSLVVAPVVALMQWKHEIETHAEGFTVCLWHGQGRIKVTDLKKFDVVLVSYGTLEASFRRQQRGFKRGNLFIKEKSPMHDLEWHRIILDEAHNIKERSTNAAKAAFALLSKYKWCLSGTPLQNRVGELYSLVRFLGADPFSHYFCKKCDCKSLHWQFTDRRHCDQCGHNPMSHVCFWNTEILTPIARYGIEDGNPGHTAFKKLKILLDRMMLRRTKLERADDLDLPPRTIVVRRDYFSPQEKELYMSLFTGAKRTFATYIDQGTVLNNYSNIFSLITRMRQMACHPDLVLRSKTSTLTKGIAEGTVCRLCNDSAEDAIISACKHVFDRECIRQYLEVQQIRKHRPECPVCHIEISINLEQEAIALDEGNTRKARQGILSRLDLDSWRSSSKLEALVEELEKLRNQDCTIKSLVFSQFVSFLDLIAFRLQRAGFNVCRLEGSMTPQQRDATIQHFMNNTHVTVFLISLKAGGVALNLTEASYVFMMDSWWNPSVEYQAMDRIHRLGQKRPVKVIKLIVEDSIEDQIVQLQHKKLAMTEAALSKDPDIALGKLTVEDLGFLFKM